MGCGDRLEKADTHQVSLVSLTSVLALASVGVFIWMGAAGWKDMTGIIVGVIFVILTVLQVVFGVLWWKSQARTAQEYSVQQEESMSKGDGDSKSANNVKDDSACSGLLVYGEVKVAYTDGAQKVDVQMVEV